MNSFRDKRSKTSNNIKEKEAAFPKQIKQQEICSQKQQSNNIKTRCEPTQVKTQTTQPSNSQKRKDRHSLSIHKLAQTNGFKADPTSSSLLYSVFNKKKHSLERSCFINSQDLEMSTKDENMESFFKDVEKNKEYLKNQRQQSSLSPTIVNKNLLKVIQNNGESVQKLYKQIFNQSKHTQQEITAPRTQKQEIQCKEETNQSSSRQTSPLFGVQNEETSQKEEETQKNVGILTQNEEVSVDDQFDVSSFPSSTRENYFIALPNESLNSFNNSVAKDNVNHTISSKQNLPKSKKPSQNSFILLGKSKKDKLIKQNILPSPGTSQLLSSLRNISKEKFQSSHQLYQSFHQSVKTAQNNIHTMKTQSYKGNQEKPNKVSNSPNKQKNNSVQQEIKPIQNYKKPIFILKNKKNSHENNQIKTESEEREPEKVLSPQFSEQIKNIPQPSTNNKMILIKGNKSKKQDSQTPSSDTSNEILSQLEKLTRESKEKDLQIMRLESQLNNLSQLMNNSEINLNNNNFSNNNMYSSTIQQLCYQGNQNTEIIKQNGFEEGNQQAGQVDSMNKDFNSFQFNQVQQTPNGFDQIISEEKNILNINRQKQRQITFSAQNDTLDLEDSMRKEDLQVREGEEIQQFGKEEGENKNIAPPPIEQILSINFHQEVIDGQQTPFLSKEEPSDFKQTEDPQGNNQTKLQDHKDKSENLQEFICTNQEKVEIQAQQSIFDNEKDHFVSQNQ